MQFKKLNSNAKLPTRSYSGDAGLDLYANETVFLPLNSTSKIKLGIAVSIPFGCVGKIEDRSSLASLGLRTGGGVIDFQYRGELIVIVHNLTNSSHTLDGQVGYLVREGDKIAQLLVYDIKLVLAEFVKDLPESFRNSHGFGSTGK